MSRRRRRRAPPRGGVGGAKLVDGLARILDGDALTVVVNTGDDFVHWGLAISPDLDTVMYTLAGLAHPEQGWGLDGESFQALSMVERYGGESWFRLGDRDLATHLVRTTALAAGARLTDVTARLAGGLGVRHRILPMSDRPRRTLVDTVEHGVLSFQDWFVRHRAAPTVRRISWSDDPPPTPEVVSALAQADVVIVCPSNPYVSVDPILTLPGVGPVLASRRVVAVSPIVAGQAVKGPVARLAVELAGEPASAATIARHYGGLLAGLVVEHGDGAGVAATGVRVRETATVMRSPADRERLAAEVLAFAEELPSPTRPGEP
jgi:LPPG:FO 2-phospho-L-lactate transferase